MRLLINTATTYKGGGVQVAKSFINECQNYQDNEYHVILGLGLHDLINIKNFPSNYYFYKIDYRPATRVFKLQDQAAFFKELEEKIKPDVVFTSTGPAYWRPKAPHLMGFNLPHYLYPDSPFFSLLSRRKILKWKLKGLVIKYFAKRDADAYVTQTDDVAERLKKWIGKDNIYTVTNTYGAQYVKYKPKQDTDKKEPKEIYNLLILSAYYPHKNVEILNDIARHASEDKKSNFKFLITIEPEIYQSIFSATAKKYIQNVGPVKPEECPSLYQQSDFVFLPTLLECFSASYAEGMKMEKPIITTDLTFARSICGAAALYFEPLNGKDAYSKIMELINNETLQQTLIEEGRKRLDLFDGPKERAKKYLNLCKSLTMEANKK